MKFGDQATCLKLSLPFFAGGFEGLSNNLSISSRWVGCSPTQSANQCHLRYSRRRAHRNRIGMPVSPAYRQKRWLLFFVPVQITSLFKNTKKFRRLLFLFGNQPFPQLSISSSPHNSGKKIRRWKRGGRYFCQLVPPVAAISSGFFSR